MNFGLKFLMQNNLYLGRLLEQIKPIINVERKAVGGKLGVFVAHGTLDKVLSIAHAREAKAYLQGLDVSLTYNEYPIAHTISSEETNDLIDWLVQVNT